MSLVLPLVSLLCNRPPKVTVFVFKLLFPPFRSYDPLFMRSRRWTWTLNQPTAEEKALLSELIESLPTSTVGYLIYGEEIAPTTGTIHLQGYLEMKQSVRMTAVKNLISQRLHLEVSKGTALQNKEYCMKDGIVSEGGEPANQQGSRNDLKKIQKMIEDGATDLMIAREHFGAWTRIRSAIAEYRKMITPKRVEIGYTLSTFSPIWTEREWGYSTILWGVSGIGKTSFLKARFPTALFVTHLDDLKLFVASEYEAIIFDDMEFKYLPRTAQIHLLDSSDDRSIHIRYGTALIPARTRKLFTTNEIDGNIFELSDPAISRRVEVVEGEDFY